MYKKLIKWILIVGVTITVILHIWALINLYYEEKYPVDLGDWWRSHSHSFVINSALGIPYYNRSEVINDSSERIKLTKEDWMNLRCKPIHYETDGEYGKPYFYGEEKLLPKEISGNDIRHLNCLGVDVVDEYGNKSEKSLQGELCSNIFNCQTINLAVTDYVLENPRILKNMLKIMEQPCNYVKKLGEGQNKKEEREIESLRGYLRCNGTTGLWFQKKRVFTILTIHNKDLADSPKNLILGEFIIRRKDI